MAELVMVFTWWLLFEIMGIESGWFHKYFSASFCFLLFFINKAAELDYLRFLNFLK